MLHPRYDDDLLSLQRAASAANTNYSLASKRDESPADRGRALLRELRDTLESFFDDGVTDEFDAPVAA